MNVISDFIMISSFYLVNVINSENRGEWFKKDEVEVKNAESLAHLSICWRLLNVNVTHSAVLFVVAATIMCISNRLEIKNIKQ